MGTSNSRSTVTTVSVQQDQAHFSEGEIEYPRLKGQASVYSDSIIFSQKNLSYRLACQPHIIPDLQTLLLKMNGHHHLHTLQQQFSPEHPEQFHILMQQLATHGLIEEGKNTVSDLRQSSILKWEELFVERLSKKLQQQSLHFFAAFPPAHISYGFVLEYYHLLSHSSQFYTPLLHFQDSIKIRHHINQFYCKINRQDERLFQGFQGLGMSQEDLAMTLPLAETMALSNALTFWATSDPLFCISLLAIWEVQLIQTWEAYLSQLNSDSTDSLFLGAIQQFIQLQSQAKPEGLKHIIIAELSPFADSILERFKHQIHLFLELNHNFYIALGNYYSSNSHLLRQLSMI